MVLYLYFSQRKDTSHKSINFPCVILEYIFTFRNIIYSPSLVPWGLGRGEVVTHICLLKNLDSQLSENGTVNVEEYNSISTLNKVLSPFT